MMHATRRRDHTILALAATAVAAVTVHGGDPYLDELVLFDQPEGSHQQVDALLDWRGGPDGTSRDGFLSIDVPETLIVAFTDNLVIDCDGPDLRIHQVGPEDSEVDVYAALHSVEFVFLGRINGSADFDLADVPALSTIRYLKFVGVDDVGDTPGFNLDAVQAVNAVGIGQDADLTGDDRVDGADLGLLLSEWGSTTCVIADLDHDGVVGGGDLGVLLAQWGT